MEHNTILKAIQKSIQCSHEVADAILKGNTSLIQHKPSYQHIAHVVDILLKNIIGPYSGISSAYAQGMLSKIQNRDYNAKEELGWVYRDSRHLALSQWYRHEIAPLSVTTTLESTIPVFITVLSGDMSFIHGVKALWKSLCQCSEKEQQFQFIVLCDVTVPKEIRQGILLEWHFPTSRVEIIDTETIETPYAMSENKRWEHTFTKLQLFNLPATTYPKLIYMDSDMIAVTRDIFKLWQAPLFSAVAAGPQSLKWKSINSGLMVFRPHHELYIYMRQILSQKQKLINTIPPQAIGDQDIIQEAWETLCQWESNPKLHLSQQFNFLCLYANDYLLGSDFDTTAQPLIVLHFIGPLKPWRFITITGDHHVGKTIDQNWRSLVPYYLHRYYLHWFQIYFQK